MDDVGDVLRLFETRRKQRQRRVLLLIDVSGSMKDRSGAMLRLAHAVVQAADDYVDKMANSTGQLLATGQVRRDVITSMTS